VGRPRLVNPQEIDAGSLGVAAAMAARSRHPLSRSIAEYAVGSGPAFDSIEEKPGFGMEAWSQGSRWRLGRAEWALDRAADVGAGGTVLSHDGTKVATFVFEDALRPDAQWAIDQLEARVGSIAVLSGDGEAACRLVGDRLGISDVAASLLPAEKVGRIADLSAGGRKVLMVGDGLNDAPALGAAHVSMAPATAADVGRNAADFVFLHESLAAVPLALDISRRAGRLVRQNIALAIAYNLIAVPIAILGHVTPLIAAIAMSASSLLVISNALRLTGPAGPSRVKGGISLKPATAIR
jgi:Cu2+-exporting ATPase